MASTRPFSEPSPAGHGIGFNEAVRVWIRVALLSFGGPAGQIAVIHRIVVEEKKWIGEERFLHALNFCMLLPGPEAQQLATYVGWLLHRTRGALVAGLLFILPGMLSIMALSWLYVLAGHAAPVSAIFFGLKAAVLAIVLEAVLRIGRRALRSRLRVATAAAAFAAIFLFQVPFPLIVVAAALVGLANSGSASAPSPHPGMPGDGASALGEGMPAHARSRRSLIAALFMLLLWLLPLALLNGLPGSDPVFASIANFFSRVALFSFGGAYAVLSYVAQQGVETYHWITAREMIDGLGMAETTPGPLIMVTQFVGFLAAYREAGSMPPLLAGTLGGLLTTWVTFTPCFFWIFAGAPFVERLRHNRRATAALGMITAAVVGVILNLSIWFALHFLFGRVTVSAAGPLDLSLPVLPTADPQAFALSAAALIAAFLFRVNYGFLIAGSIGAGLLLWLVGLR